MRACWLGGGIGWLARQYGAPSLRGTRDRRRSAAAGQRPEPCRSLLGLRGGGGNFGIVTSFEFNLYPVPDTLTSAARRVHYPPVPAIPEPLRGASAIVIMVCYTK